MCTKVELVSDKFLNIKKKKKKKKKTKYHLLCRTY